MLRAAKAAGLRRFSRPYFSVIKVTHHNSRLIAAFRRPNPDINRALAVRMPHGRRQA